MAAGRGGRCQGRECVAELFLLVLRVFGRFGNRFGDATRVFVSGFGGLRHVRFFRATTPSGRKPKKAHTQIGPTTTQQRNGGSHAAGRQHEGSSVTARCFWANGPPAHSPGGLKRDGWSCGCSSRQAGRLSHPTRRSCDPARLRRPCMRTHIPPLLPRCCLTHVQASRASAPNCP